MTMNTQNLSLDAVKKLSFGDLIGFTDGFGTTRNQVLVHRVFKSNGTLKIQITYDSADKTHRSLENLNVSDLTIWKEGSIVKP